MPDSETVHLRGSAARLVPDDIKPVMARHAINDTANLPETSAPRSEAAEAPRAEAPARPKLGAEHAKSMLKQGFHELTAALVALPDSNIRPVEEPGVFGNEHMPHIRSNAYAEPAAQEPDRSPCP